MLYLFEKLRRLPVVLIKWENSVLLREVHENFWCSLLESVEEVNFACFLPFFALQRLKTCSLPDLRMLFEAAAATGHVESLEAQLVKDEKDAEEDGDEGDADSDYGDDDELDEVDAEEIVTIEDDGDDEEEEEELNFERSVKNYAAPIHGLSQNRVG